MKNYSVEFDGMDMPWVESPFFYDLLSSENLTDEELKLAINFHEEGYIVLDLDLNESLIDKTIEEIRSCDNYKSQEAGYHYSEYPRIFEAWRWSRGALELAKSRKVLETLRFLYRREPLPFQTINFVGGAQQPLHSDTIHFSSIPQRWLCASWIALEDVGEENGALMYVPKSHRLPIFEFRDIGVSVPEYGEQFNAYAEYEDFVAQLVKSQGLEVRTLEARKGQAIIWSANLIHGSIPIADKNRSRYSQATHYYFSGCSRYYSPMFSDTLGGKISDKDLSNKDILGHEL
tara:strand:+ start:266 stop:1132 length:867 start_codon:yes stop_codon:yes gene_type:complete